MTSMKYSFKRLYVCSCVVWNFAGAQPDLPGCIWTTLAFDDGKVSSEGCLVAGQPEGIWRSYHANGQLKSEGLRENHLLEGVWVFFNEEGIQERRVEYSRGERDGLDMHFDSNGQCVLEIPWRQGVRDGWMIERFPSGQIQRKIPLVEGLENGKGKEFAEDGRLISFLDYRDGFLRSLESFNRLDSQGKRHGNWVVFRDEQHRIKKEEGPYRHGVKHGVFKWFDRQGNLDQMVQYENGVLLEEEDQSAFLLDIRRTYHPNGQVYSVGAYRDDLPQGVFRLYDEKGQLSGGEYYEAGQLSGRGITNPAGERDGEWIFYYPDESIKSRGGYIHGQREGEWIFYFESGKVAQTGSYRAGSFHGNWVWYYESGNIHRTERYRNGKKDGMFEELDEQGHVLLQGEYIGDLRNGLWVYEVNDHKEEGEYIDDEWNGEWIHTYDNGQKRFQGSFNFGQPVGKHTMWYRTGRTQWSGKYEGGVRDGKWFFYDEAGILETTLQYDLGILVKINGNKVSMTQGDPEENQ